MDNISPAHITLTENQLKAIVGGITEAAQTKAAIVPINIGLLLEDAGISCEKLRTGLINEFEVHHHLIYR